MNVVYLGIARPHFSPSVCAKEHKTRQSFHLCRIENGRSRAPESVTGKITPKSMILNDHGKRRMSAEYAPVYLLVGTMSFCANNKKRQSCRTVFISKFWSSIIDDHMTTRIINWRSIIRLDYDVCLMKMTNFISFQVKLSCSHHFIKFVILVYPNEAVRGMTAVENFNWASIISCPRIVHGSGSKEPFQRKIASSEPPWHMFL